MPDEAWDRRLNRSQVARRRLPLGCRLGPSTPRPSMRAAGYVAVVQK
jgi:hypothetical protein